MGANFAGTRVNAVSNIKGAADKGISNVIDTEIRAGVNVGTAASTQWECRWQSG